MRAAIRITVLADNTVATRDTRGEHGLAFWIDTGERHLLFDTGQGLVLADNAQALHVDVDAVNAIVLSHGHYDHTGGLATVLRQAAGEVSLYAHPDALLRKYHRAEGETREIGIPSQSRDALSNSPCRPVLSREPVEVAPGILTTGEIPRRRPEEAITEPFCRDPEGRQADLLPDDQALFIGTAQGTVVLLGCAHAGIINTLDHVQGLTEGKPVRAVVGGMHLRAAAEDRIAWTIRELRRFDSKLLVPMHCTGQKAVAALWAAFPHACQAGGAGTLFEF